MALDGSQLVPVSFWDSRSEASGTNESAEEFNRRLDSLLVGFGVLTGDMRQPQHYALADLPPLGEPAGRRSGGRDQTPPPKRRKYAGVGVETPLLKKQPN